MQILGCAASGERCEGDPAQADMRVSNKLGLRPRVSLNWGFTQLGLELSVSLNSGLGLRVSQDWVCYGFW